MEKRHGRVMANKDVGREDKDDTLDVDMKAKHIMAVGGENS